MTEDETPEVEAATAPAPDPAPELAPAPSPEPAEASAGVGPIPDETAPGPQPQAEPEIEPEPAAKPELEPQPAPTPPPRISEPAPAAPAAIAARRRWSWRRIALTLLAVLVLGPPLWVLVYRIVPPPGTILMAQRAIEGHGWDYRWRPLSQISPALIDAAVASEDAGFCTHHGFDFDAMQRAIKHNERRPNRIKGGSTISQQTAKNVFLWPGRDYVRKTIEAGYTVLIETVWGKRRIMEVYLNVVEFGPGVYGAQAAAQDYFHVDASQLSPAQAARLVAVLPRPLKWSAEAPGRYVAGRSRKIDERIGTVREAGLADCVLR